MPTSTVSSPAIRPSRRRRTWQRSRRSVPAARSGPRNRPRRRRGPGGLPRRRRAGTCPGSARSPCSRARWSGDIRRVSWSPPCRARGSSKSSSCGRRAASSSTPASGLPRSRGRCRSGTRCSVARRTADSIFPVHQLARDGAMSAAAMLEMLTRTRHEPRGGAADDPRLRAPQGEDPVPATAGRARARRAPDGLEPRTRTGSSTSTGSKIYRGSSWILLRPSGTEPLLRVFAEATDAAAADALVREAMATRPGPHRRRRGREGPREAVAADRPSLGPISPVPTGNSSPRGTEAN